MSLSVQLVPRSSHGLFTLAVFTNHRSRIRPCCVHSISRRLDRVRFDERGNLPFVVGITLRNHGQCIGLIAFGFVTEARAARVVNEEIRAQEMLPPLFRRPQTPVVFLAITATKGVLVKKPHIINRRTAQIHAETHTSRNLHHLPAIRLAKKRIHCFMIQPARQFVIPAEVRI